MWERFTKRAKHVVTAAQEEAPRLGSEHVRTEHILLGLCREPDGIAGRALKNLGVNLDELRERVIQRATGGPAFGPAFTPRAKKALACAVEEARQLNHNYIGTEHILLGLVNEGEGIAAKVLEDMKLDREQIRSEVVRILDDMNEPSQ